MKHRHKRFIVGGLLLVAVLPGCGGRSSADAGARKAARSPAASSTTPATTGDSAVDAQPPAPSPKPTTGQATDTAADASAGTATDTFVAPYPEKLKEALNLFSPPKQTIVVTAAREEKSDDDPVRLVGFVNVDQQKALLSIGDKLELAAVGDRVQGVEVVAIDHLIVTLQRGTQRWSTALLDQPVINRPTTTTQYVGSQTTDRAQRSPIGPPPTPAEPRVSPPEAPLPGFPPMPEADELNAPLGLPELPESGAPPFP